MAITAASTVALTRLRAAGASVRLHSRYPSGVNLDVGGTLVYAGTHAAGGACSLQVTAEDVEVLAGSTPWTWVTNRLVSTSGSAAVTLAERAWVYEPIVPRLSTLDPSACRRLQRARTAARQTSWFDAGLGLEVALPRLRAAVIALVAGGHEPAVLVRGVIGLGSGLTPSCDDALVGALCLLHACGQRPAVSRADLLQHDAPTTDVSASALRLASTGVFSIQLARVVGELDGGQPADDIALELAVRALVAVGASSGSDSLVGLELACQALTAGLQTPQVLSLS